MENMVWLQRLLLGLPPRKEDIDFILKHFPEIFETDFKITSKKFRKYFDPIVDVQAVKDWIKCTDSIEKKSKTNLCPKSDCPVKTQDETVTSEEHSKENIIELMGVGGFHKGPRDLFFDMVKNSIKGMDVSKLQRFICTDRFLHRDKGETGEGGGWQNLVDLLLYVGIGKQATFSLEVSPAIDFSLNNSFRGFLQTNFPSMSLKHHRAGYFIHDRFYLFKYQGEEWKGVYGPSLNGLNTQSIALVGLIENVPQALQVLVKNLE